MPGLSNLRIGVFLALLSFPFWFLSLRFARQLGVRSHPYPSVNWETKEALIAACVAALLTFLLSLYVNRNRSC
jgi:hypothetical protein